MKIIAIVSTKGGVGKSTSCNILACRLAEANQPVHILELDPQNSQRHFIEKTQEIYKTITATTWEELTTSQNKTTSHDPIEAAWNIIDEHADKPGFLVIDVQGSDNNLLHFALGAGDIILIPIMDGTQEITTIPNTITAINTTQRTHRRKFNMRWFWTNVQGIGLSNAAIQVERDLVEAGFQMLGRNLVSRSAYKHIARNGDLVQKKGLDKAKTESDMWLKSIISTLKEGN